MSTVDTRILDSKNYDDALDVLQWLNQSVGAKAYIPPPDELEDTDTLFVVVDNGGGEHGVVHGTVFVYDREHHELAINPPTPDSIIIHVQ